MAHNKEDTKSHHKDIILAVLLTIKDPAMVNTIGKMDRYIKENGIMDLDMAMAFGNPPKEITTSDNGQMERWKDMEFI
jgi:hypothetical protein